MTDMSNFGWGNPTQWGTPTPPQQTPTLEQALQNYQNQQGMPPATQAQMMPPGANTPGAAPAGGWRNLTPQQQMFLMQMMRGGGAQAQNPLMARGFNAGQMTPQQMQMLQQILAQRGLGGATPFAQAQGAGLSPQQMQLAAQQQQNAAALNAQAQQYGFTPQ